MVPPKFFLKRLEDFYNKNGLSRSSHKIENGEPQGSTGSNPATENPSLKAEENNSNDYYTSPWLHPSFLNASMSEPNEGPLDLSCKYNDLESEKLLKNLNNFFMQQQLAKLKQTIIANNNYINLERLLLQIPQPSFSLPNEIRPFNPIVPKIFVTSSPTNCDIDTPFTLLDRPTNDNGLHLSPCSNVDTRRDRSSSDTSSPCALLQPKIRASKRKVDGKPIRPFKLYKGTESESVMEALGINSDDEEWLKTVVEYKNVDDVFQFLTNCMDDSTRPEGVDDDEIEKIQIKFGHILRTCNNSVSNPRMVRRPDMTPLELKTEEYWEKRRKNNEAAKRSRETRRNKEEALNQRCEKLQAENDALRKEIELIKQQIDSIKGCRI